MLHLKGVDWVSHPVNLLKAENYTPWYLGINPRGLVPTLVHNGDVQIESNGIISYLDETFTTPRLIPDDQKLHVQAHLQDEDGLHFDLRTLAFGFVLPRFLAGKPPEALDALEAAEGHVEGQPNDHKYAQLAFWRGLAQHGIPPEQATASANRFKAAFTDLEKQRADQPYLFGDSLSAFDIAWFIYAHRLISTGYPFMRLIPA